MVHWNGTPLLDSAPGLQLVTLTATVPQSLLLAAGPAQVTVVNTDSSVSNAEVAPIVGPALTGVSQPSEGVGASGLNLTLGGSCFVNDSLVEWRFSPSAAESCLPDAQSEDGQLEPLSAASGSLSVRPPTGPLRQPGILSFAVDNTPAGATGDSSESVDFSILCPSIDQDGVRVVGAPSLTGTMGVTIKVQGENFVAASEILVDGEKTDPAPAKNFVSDTLLRAFLQPGSDATTPGIHTAGVKSPGVELVTDEFLMPGFEDVTLLDFSALQFAFVESLEETQEGDKVQPQLQPFSISLLSGLGLTTLPLTACIETTETKTWLGFGEGLTQKREGEAKVDSPAIFSVTADPRRLGPGAYSGKIVVFPAELGCPKRGGSLRLRNRQPNRAKAAEIQTIEIPVDLVVSEELEEGKAAQLRLTRRGLVFKSVEEDGLEEGRIPGEAFQVQNIGRGVMDWKIDEITTLSGEGWLLTPTLTCRAGVNAAGDGCDDSLADSLGDQVEVQVDVTPTSRRPLAPGRYHGQIKISSENAVNSPRVVTVVLDVLSSLKPASLPAVMPTGLGFGGAGAASQKVEITNFSGRPVSVEGEFTLESGVFDFGETFMFDFEAEFESGCLRARPTLGSPNVLQSSIPGGGCLAVPIGLKNRPGDSVVRRDLRLTFAGLGELADQEEEVKVRLLAIVPEQVPAASSGVARARAKQECGKARKLIVVVTQVGESNQCDTSLPNVVRARLFDDCGQRIISGDTVEGSDVLVEEFDVFAVTDDGSSGTMFPDPEAKDWAADLPCREGEDTLRITAEVRTGEGDVLTAEEAVVPFNGRRGDDGTPRIGAATGSASSGSTVIARGSQITILGEDFAPQGKLPEDPSGYLPEDLSVSGEGGATSRFRC